MATSEILPIMAMHLVAQLFSNPCHVFHIERRRGEKYAWNTFNKTQRTIYCCVAMNMSGGGKVNAFMGIRPISSMTADTADVLNKVLETDGSDQHEEC